MAHFLKKSFFWWANPGFSFSLFAVFFKQISIQFLQQNNVKNIHPVYGAGIQIHNRHNVSLLP